MIEVLIIEYIKANPQIKQKEIIETSGESKRSIQECFANLQAKGLIKREGSKMNGRWIVND